MSNAANWFEIPVNNFERAKKFYSTVLASELTDHPMGDSEYAVFPYNPEEKGVGGAIIASKDYKPSQEGALVFLNGGDDLASPLSRVEAAGGTIVMPKTAIGENGFIAQFIDTEGNKVALHSMT